MKKHVYKPFRPATLLRDSNTEICEIFKDPYFEEHPQTTASEFYVLIKSNCLSLKIP